MRGIDVEVNVTSIYEQNPPSYSNLEYSAYGIKLEFYQNKIHKIKKIIK